MDLKLFRNGMLAAYLINALDRGTWVIFPKNGNVGGPGGKFLGRRLTK
jgi:hypothetical protein